MNAWYSSEGGVRAIVQRRSACGAGGHGLTAADIDWSRWLRVPCPPLGDFRRKLVDLSLLTTFSMADLVADMTIARGRQMALSLWEDWSVSTRANKNLDEHL